MGLFGYCGDKSNIKNIVISNANITSTKNCVGGLVGRNYGTIDRVKTEGGEITAKQYVGGITGENYGEITSSSNSAKITENETIDPGKFAEAYVGGITGKNYNRNKRMF